MENNTNPYTRAVGALAELFYSAAIESSNFSELESRAIDVGHACMADAFGLALEAYDAKLLREKPASLKAHDVRKRTLATEIGDVAFSARRYRDRFGCDVYLLADALDIAYGTRLSPGAEGFLVEAAAHVSYAKSAKLLGRHGSHVEPTTVMNCMRKAGLLCAEQDEEIAYDLYKNGVAPEAECERESLCIEADGTYFSVQKPPEGAPKRMEVKAIVAYEGKEAEGGKVRRRGNVHHGLVGHADEIWAQGIGAVGQKYDLSKLKRIHLGGDGEAWCKNAQAYLPKADVVFHLDPFHMNRALLSCFSDKAFAWNVIGMINDGDKESALSLLSFCKDQHIGYKDRLDKVMAYLSNNIDAIAIDGPTLGTMESENQHLYGVRMDAFPCAWSIRGASDMARIISRRESKRAIPKMTREKSMGLKRKQKRKAKELAYYERKAPKTGRILETVGKGYLPPHQVEIRKMQKDKAYALLKGIERVGRGI